MKYLGKKTLIKELSKIIPAPINLIEELFTDIITSISKILHKKRSLNLQKFGTFKLTTACKGGAGILKKENIKEKLYVSFRPSRPFKRLINNGYEKRT